MNTSQLNRAWILLVGLSLGTTLLAQFVPNAGMAFVAMVLVLSALKARVILMDYLCLSQAPGFRGGFTTFLAGFVTLAFVLYAIA
ncbi:nitric oxide reductase F protein [Alisedimentitalea sp. MJ-SS2]|uniref:nitric oxide reductase F protein n=1 Tax=Aliisedimentitalea sp. MJ-SS2 TaxID=3049795 RepID=UPI002906B4ED|nr:nitric oxide reductase F protein [Alisedimentitalea sp. MJ-SS2]MDU8928515.1 nitric oxide reductase F protein [Alisedimentitalea sp. MJ-SS2]